MNIASSGDDRCEELLRLTVCSLCQLLLRSGGG